MGQGAASPAILIQPDKERNDLFACWALSQGFSERHANSSINHLLQMTRSLLSVLATVRTLLRPSRERKQMK